MKRLTSILFERRALLLALAFGLAVSGCAKMVGGSANPNSNQPVPTPTATAETKEVKRIQQPTPAAEKNNILFIIDSSGSMRTKAGNKTKMEAAKEVVTALIGRLPAETQAGLMAYGHRRKGDCTDVEVLVPIGPVQPDVFGQKVQALQPLGETPITFSIRQAADVLKGLGGKKTVILISDGEETCKQDPCAVAAELKAADVALQVHVVGFGIDTPLAKKQLNCIAEATGGTYKDAANAADLKKSLEGMAKAEASSGEKGNLVTVSHDSNGNPLSYMIVFYKPGDDKTELNPALDFGIISPHSLIKVAVVPGTYDLRYWTPYLPTVWKRNVEIKAGQETRVDLGDFGRIRFSFKDQSGANIGGYGDIHKPGETELFTYSVPSDREVQELPAGIYDVRFWDVDSHEVWRRGIEVRSGQETLVEITINK